MYEPTDYDWWKNDYEPFNNTSARKYFSMSQSYGISWFTNEQAHDCTQLRMKADRGGTFRFDTKIEEKEIVWGDNISLTEINDDDDENEIDDQWKTPKEIQKVLELDNLNRQWKPRKGLIEAFIEQKKRNIIEFQQLCQRFSNI